MGFRPRAAMRLAERTIRALSAFAQGMSRRWTARGRRLLDDIEHALAERRDELPAVDRADAPAHAGAEIALDPL